MKLYCLIGDPVSHSLSPAMYNAEFEARGISAVYIPITVRKNDLKSAIANLKAIGASGINVTAPHKMSVMQYLDRIDRIALEIGAVNTIVNDNGKLIGYNTDVFGAVAAIKNKVKNLKGKTALVLGKGGAARAVSYGLRQEGVTVKILDRRSMKRIPELLDQADMLCNCTPVGMHGGMVVPKKLLRKGLVVFDAVYRNGGTRLINNAIAMGAIAIGGQEMLVGQGVAAFELYTGIKPDAKIMMDIVKRKLNEKKKVTKNPIGTAKNIYLIGSMGTGKSSVGELLAKRLRMNFIDVDNEIEKTAKKSINDIFAKSGEQAFRKLEVNAITNACKKANSVVSVGGGAVLNYLNISNMKQSGKIILLRTNPKSIVQRLDGEETRPLLLGLNKKQRLEKTKKLLRHREPFYYIAKDLEVHTDDRNLEETAGEITQLLGAKT